MEAIVAALEAILGSLCRLVLIDCPMGSGWVPRQAMAGFFARLFEPSWADFKVREDARRPF